VSEPFDVEREADLASGLWDVSKRSVQALLTRCHDAAVEETEQICGADKKRLNWLESVETGYGEGWVCRISTTGRGWRLHETGRHDGIEPSDVRGAVDNARCEYERRRAREEEW